MADTRKHRRAPVSLKVRFKSATVDDFIEHYSSDISSGGLFIKSKTPMAVGTLLKFEVQLKDESRLIHGVGRVIWKLEVSEAGDESQAGMGIKFIKMDPESRQRVQQIVEARGELPGRFEDGGTRLSTEPPMFPVDGPSEDELPPPEDRTEIRHASEFLESALAAADESAQKEARRGAVAARRRTAELRRIREEESDAVARDPRRPSDDEEIAPRRDSDRPKSEPRPVAPMAKPPTASESTDAVKANDTPTASARPAARASERPRTPQRSVSTYRPKEEEPKSRLLPIVLAVAAVAVAGYLLFPAGPDEQPAPVARPAEPDSTPTVAEPTENERRAVELTEQESQPTETTETADQPVEETAIVDPAGEEPPPTVAVEVRSTPTGGTVRVNGESRGETPATVELPVGQEVTVSVKAAGYAETSRQVTANETQPALSFTLERLPHMLSVATNPTGAQVAAEGNSINAPGEINLGPLRSSSVSVVALYPGYRTMRRRIELSDFEERDGHMHYSLEIALQPEPVAAQTPTTPAIPADREPPNSGERPSSPTTDERPSGPVASESPQSPPTEEGPSAPVEEQPSAPPANDAPSAPPEDRPSDPPQSPPARDRHPADRPNPGPPPTESVPDNPF